MTAITQTRADMRVTKTMRAAVVEAPGRVAVVTTPTPAPARDEILVKLEGCGVCASNLGPWAGPPWMRFPTEPGALGHEGWGRIAAVGEEVSGHAVGDRVAFLGQRSYAEYDVVAASGAVRIPDALNDEPFPGEPLGCAMNIFARSDIRAGQDVAIVGVGFLGALLVKLASDAGARVLAIGRRPFALDLARRMGAAEAIAMDDRRALAERVGALTQGRMCARVIEAAGKQATLDLASDLVAVRGRLVIAGYHQDGPRQVDMQSWNWRGIDVVNAHERDPQVYMDGMRAAIEATLSGALDPAGLCTHAYPLDRLAEALDATRDRPDGFLKACVTFR